MDDYIIHVQGVIFELSEQTGALVVYWEKYRRGNDVTAYLRERAKDNTSTLAEFHANCVGRVINGQSTFAAIFPRLPAGEYYIAGRDTSAYVTVFPGEIAEVDWRD